MWPQYTPPGGPDALSPRSALLRGLRGLGTHVLQGCAHRARTRYRQLGCPLKKGRWRRALSLRDWKRRDSQRTCEESETGLVTGRGGSPERELARAGRRCHPTCPRPAQVRPAQVRLRAAAREPHRVLRPVPVNRAGRLGGGCAQSVHPVTRRVPARLPGAAQTSGLRAVPTRSGLPGSSGFVNR